MVSGTTLPPSDGSKFQFCKECGAEMKTATTFLGLMFLCPTDFNHSFEKIDGVLLHG